MSAVILCARATLWVRAVRWCPVCKRRRRMVGFDQLWYGVTWTCLGCGDSWSHDGELLERPYKRGWRREAVASARPRWDLAVRVSGAKHRAWLRHQLAEDRAVVAGQDEEQHRAMLYCDRPIPDNRASRDQLLTRETANEPRGETACTTLSGRPPARPPAGGCRERRSDPRHRGCRLHRAVGTVLRRRGMEGPVMAPRNGSVATIESVGG